MLELADVKKSTDEVMEKLELGELEIPEPSAHWQRKIEALEEADLENHRRAAIFDMRCEQAGLLGFHQINTSDMVEMLMGERPTRTIDGDTRHTYEWVYFHMHDEVETKTNWGGKPTIFIRERQVRAKRWWWPPFAKKTVEDWRCQFGKLDYLKREIPYGVVLKLNELKKLKLFNCFNILAPMEAWERKTDIDPILVGTLWEFPLDPNDDRDKDGHSHSAGQTAHFFIAQW